MANKVVITTDTGCDLCPELLEKYNITDMVPLYINMGDKSYKDCYECKPDDLFRYFEQTKQVPKTAAPPPNDYLEIFSKYAEQGCDIVHISMNSVFSSSYANSMMAAREINEKYNVKVYSVDSYTLSGAQAHLAINAAEMAQRCMSAEDIANEATSMVGKLRTDFLLGGMNYAAKGGRCSMLVAFGANLLKLYPMMHIDHQGVITAPKKFRGSVESVQNQYYDYVLNLADKYADYRRVVVNYTGMEQKLVDNMSKRLKDYGKFEEIVECQTNCTTATHGGPNTVCMMFMDK